MDLDEVKACLRALLSSTVYSYHINNLLNDFRNMTGFDLPLFGYLHPVQFLKSLGDTVQLFGDPYNPQIALVESKKSAHITSLVDRQKNSALRTRNLQIALRQKRLIIPNTDSEMVTSSRNDRVFRFTATSNDCAKVQKPSQSHHKSTLQSRTKYSVSTFTSFTPTCFTDPPSKLDSFEVNKNEAAAQMVPNPDRSCRDSFSSENCKTKVDNSSEQYPKYKKSDSCYFEDVSDGEGLFSVDDFKTSDRSSSSYCSVNDGIINKLKKLIKQHPDGLWCCELAELFLKEYNFALDYREFGYTSLIQMLSELPDVFRCVRPGNEDWILFDASTAPTRTEKKMTDLESTLEPNCEIRTNVQKLLLNHIESTLELGVKLEEIPDLYQNMFGKKLDFESIGFKDLKSLFETFEGTFVNLLKVDGKTIVAPVLKKTPKPEIQWEEAVPPITEENDIFREIFPKDVVGPDERFVELDLNNHIAVGHVIKICVAEVWSPSKFYIQLNKYKNRLNQFMDDLQKFYGAYLNKYKMPEATIRANQVCVGLYNSDPDYPDEWHRAQIVKIVNEKMVLVNFVDYGTVTRVKKTQLRFLHRSFQSFPVQGFLTKLSGIVPPCDEKIWPVISSKKFLEYLRVPNLDAEIVEVDFKIPCLSVVLYNSYQNPETNINKKLVKEKLAKLMDPLPDNLVILQDRENQTRRLGVNSSELSVHKNLSERTDAFSDIDDSSQPTLFHYKMKALKIEDSLRVEKKNEDDEKSSGVVFEFDEVPELESNSEKEPAGEKENTSKKFDDEIKSKLAPLPQKKLPVAFLPGNPEEKSKSSAPEVKFLPPVEKPKRCPPGLKRLSPAPDFSQIQFLVQPEDIKKRINVLTLELLSANPSIKQVGMMDPTLALKIATEMAEAYVRSEYANKLPFGFNPLVVNPYINGFAQPPPNAFEAKGPVAPVAPVIPVIPLVVKLPEEMNPINDSLDATRYLGENSSEINRDKAKHKNTYVKKVSIGGKVVHLVVIDSQFYLGMEELVRTFTLISNGEVAGRVLHIKKISMTYRIVSKKTDEDAYNAIKRSEMVIVKKKTKKMKFYLISLSMTLPFLQALGCFIKSFESDIEELIKLESAGIQNKPS